MMYETLKAFANEHDITFSMVTLHYGSILRWLDMSNQDVFLIWHEGEDEVVERWKKWGTWMKKDVFNSYSSVLLEEDRFTFSYPHSDEEFYTNALKCLVSGGRISSYSEYREDNYRAQQLADDYLCADDTLVLEVNGKVITLCCCDHNENDKWTVTVDDRVEFMDYDTVNKYLYRQFKTNNCKVLFYK